MFYGIYYLQKDVIKFCVIKVDIIIWYNLTINDNKN